MYCVKFWHSAIRGNTAECFQTEWDTEIPALIVEGFVEQDQRTLTTKGHAALAHPRSAWIVLCKRTGDPKLAWIERTLRARGIQSRRNGSSFHGPILEVPSEHAEAAWAFLSEPFDGEGEQSVDDVEDDHPTFLDE